MIFGIRFVIVIIAFGKQATIAQVVERNIGNVEVTGPTPVSSFFIIFSIYAALSGFFVVRDDTIYQAYICFCLLFVYYFSNFYNLLPQGHYFYILLTIY